MIITSLSKLAKFLDEDSVPLWVREQLQERRDAIIAALDLGGSYELRGPKGEVITISGKPAVPEVKPEANERAI